MSFEEALKNMLDGHYNYNEGCRIGKIISTDGVTVDFIIETQDMEPFREVPVLKPAFGVVGDLNLSKGDYILVAFIEGAFNSPIVIGRL